MSHQLAFAVSAPLGIVLVLHTDGSRERAAATVYAVAVAFMFGASGLYNGITWSPRVRAWLCRVDHAGIYLLIAGSYTPAALLLPSGDRRAVLLAVVWSGAAAAIVFKFCWVRAPKWLSAAIAIALGWAGVFVLPDLAARLAPAGFALLVAGGLAYTLGGIIYARRRPNPAPSVFGYHEVFHVLVILGVALQYVAIAFYVLPA